MDHFLEGGRLKKRKMRKGMPGYVQNDHGKWVLKSRRAAGLRLYKSNPTVRMALMKGQKALHHKKSKSRR